MIDLVLVKWKESDSNSNYTRVKSLQGDITTEEYPVLAIPISENDEIRESLIRCLSEKICQFEGEDSLEINDGYIHYGYFQFDHSEVDEVMNIAQLIGNVVLFDMVKIFYDYIDHDGYFTLERLVRHIKEGKVVP